MICRKCGSEIREDAKFCPSCGENVEKKKERANVFLVILSVIFPIVGFILFLVKRKSDPKNSKSCGIACAAGMIVWMICIVTVLVLPFFLVFNYFDNVFDKFEKKRIEEVKKNTNYDAKPWEDYTLTYDGKSFTLPISYEEFSNITGYELIGESESLGTGSCQSLDVTKGEKELEVYLCNNTFRRLKYEKLNVNGVKQKYNHEEVEKNDDLFAYPNNLKIGQNLTQNEVTAMFGEPTYLDYRGVLAFTYYADYYYSLNPKKVFDSYYEISLSTELERIEILSLRKRK